MAEHGFAAVQMLSHSCFGRPHIASRNRLEYSPVILKPLLDAKIKGVGRPDAVKQQVADRVDQRDEDIVLGRFGKAKVKL